MAMEAFTNLRSKLIALLDGDVDTDQIIPAQYVTASGTATFAAALFANRRAQDVNFILNRAEMRDRQVMLVGSNFGCGSSREAAVWALRAYGIRALIGPSFNHTFYNNCLQNGVLPATVPPELYQCLCNVVAAQPDMTILIDLTAQRVDVPEANITFPTQIEPFARDLLIRGIDELDYLMRHRDQIAAYETKAKGLR